MIEKSPPSDADAEMAVLGSILLDRDAILLVADRLASAHFYNEKHGWIYAAMLACFAARTPPDPVTVRTELRRQGRLDLVGGAAYLHTLSNSVPTAVHIGYYARIVKQAAMARRLIIAGGKIAALGYDEALDPDEAMSQATLQLLDVQDDAGPKVAAGDAVLSNALAGILSDDKQRSPSTGFVGLDDYVSFREGKLFLIAGRPGSGKSTAAGPITDAFLEQGHQVLLFSGEMDSAENMNRWLSRKTGIGMKALTDRRLTPAQQEAVGVAAAEIHELITYVDGDGAERSRWHVMDKAATIHEVERAALRLRHQNPQPLLVIIDHIGLLSPFPGTKPSDTYASATLNSKAAKRLAMTARCAVLALVQMNREIEKRGSGRPHLSDLRDTGSLEQDADIIGFLVKSESFIAAQESAVSPVEKERIEGIVHLFVEKNRNGATCMVNLMTNFARFDMRG